MSMSRVGISQMTSLPSKPVKEDAYYENIANLQN